MSRRRIESVLVCVTTALVLGGHAIAPASADAAAAARPPRASSSPVAAAPRQRTAAHVPSGDFNGDGLADLAVGVPGETLGSAVETGAVNVLYASAGGLAAAGAQLWTQDSSGVPDVSETGDEFGFALASGDFDGDGFGDLAIGTPGENLGSVTDAGSVTVLYGSASGLASARSQQWTQDSSGVTGVAEGGDLFGSAVATGDLNGDGFADLAIGAPGESVGSVADAGDVTILYGSSSGLTSAGNQLWDQDSADVNGVSETADRLGFSLATGDANGDGFADLAAGAPGESVGSAANAGAVNVLYGSSSGLTATGNNLWYQDATNVVGASEAQDAFGYSAAFGDFNHDGYEDLAIGVPFEDVGSKMDAGGVNVLAGSATGLTTAGNRFWTQDTSGVPDQAESGDEFGFALASADVDGAGSDDLAVGVVGEDPSTGAKPGAGAVEVIPGSDTGLTATGAQVWTQDTGTVIGSSESGDEFGFALAAFQGRGRDAPADLAIGVPGEDVGTVKGAGAINVLYGTSSGLSSADNQEWDQNSSGVPDSAEGGDQFGFALASGTAAAASPARRPSAR